jgi:glycosyltransferase involved in cell wall biosynthesis
LGRERIAFVLEQALGHVTFARNLQDAVASDPDVIPTWFPIEFAPEGVAARLPVIRTNWSIRASYLARTRLGRAGAPAAFDAVFFHTQVTALLSVALLRRVGGIISVDATPRQYDELGLVYGHSRGVEVLERAKDALYRRVFAAAAHLVTWSDWARDSLIRAYGVPPKNVTTIPPGTRLDLWRSEPRPVVAVTRPRLLFVGGDLQRKGGDLLLDSYRQQLAAVCELDVVTSSPLQSPPPGVQVHHDVAPNSPSMRRLFAQADIFVLPTRADTFGIALLEAMASSLPVVTTDVGALCEVVRDGVNGLIIPPADGDALALAVNRLVADPALRARMGRAGRRIAEERFDARRNGLRLLDLLKDCATARRRRNP